ncbi:MAG: class I SAM-dependent methyltransferase [Cyclobacteriaceae bacterium]|nr:class I SAM-dependent methyltransferase [Cyclobacteriaceae bacterium]
MKNIRRLKSNTHNELPIDEAPKVRLDFGHFATTYTQSKQRSSAGSQAVIKRLMFKHGVLFDSIVDFGIGDGYWSNTIASLGYATKRIIGVDISEGMLERAQNHVIAGNVEFVHGSVQMLSKQNLDGIDTIFAALVAHLMPFPRGISELVALARERSIRHVVVLEEVSPLYLTLTGNPGFDDYLPPLLSKVFSAYIEMRSQLGVASIGSLRKAPFPTPEMPLASWKLLGLDILDYAFDVPDVSWEWHYSAADLVDEIGRRGFSILFCHSDEESRNMAAKLREDFSSDAEFTVKKDIPFWYQLHVFKTV